MSDNKRVRNPITNPEVFLVADGTSAAANLGYSNVEQVKSKLGINNLQVTGANAVNLQSGTNSVTLNTITIRSSSPSSDVTLPAQGAIATVASVVESFPPSTTTYTLLPTDNGKILEFTSPAPVTVVLPLTTTFPIGFNLTVTQKGGGRVTFLPTSSSVSLRHPYNSNSTLGQFATCRLYVSAVNEYVLSGDTNNQGAISQPGGGSSSVTSIIKEIFDTNSYFLQLSDNSVTLHITAASDFYLVIPEDLPVGYNVELFKIGQGRIILSPQGRTKITHPNLHNAVTGNFAKAKLQVISSSQLNILWSFTGDTAFINTELINEFYNLTLSGDELKNADPNLDVDAPIPFTFNVRKLPPEIEKTFNVEFWGASTGTPNNVRITTGSLNNNYVNLGYRPNLEVESGSSVRFVIELHHRLSSNLKFTIMRNGQPLVSPEIIYFDTNAGNLTFDSYDVIWNIPATPSAGTYTYGVFNSDTNQAISTTTGSFTIINRGTNFVVAWSITPIENLSANDFIGNVIPQGSLSFARSALTEEKTFSFSLKNIPNLTSEQQKLFRVNVAATTSAVSIVNNSIESKFAAPVPPDILTLTPDPSAFTARFGNNIVFTSVTPLPGTGRFLLKVDRRCLNQYLSVGKFLSINKEPSSSAIERLSLNKGSYLMTQVTDNNEQDIDVEIIKPFGYITGSTFSSIGIQGDDRTQVVLTVKWIGFIPPSLYPLLVRDHITSIANSFAINNSDFTVPGQFATYLFRYAPESVTRISTNVNGVTTDEITYIVNVPYISSLNNFPFTGQLNDPNNPNPFQGITFSTIIDNGQPIPFSGTVTIEPIPFTRWFSLTEVNNVRTWSFPSFASESLLFYSQTTYIVEFLPRSSTLGNSKILLISSNTISRFGSLRFENVRLAIQDELSINEEFTLTNVDGAYSQSTLATRYPEGRYKVINITQKSIVGQSRYVDIDVEIVSTTENDKSYVGNATIISHGLSPRSYPTGRPIIQTDLIEYNQGKLSGELIGTVIKTLEPQSYYSFNSRSGFQITGNNEDSFFNISVTGEISLTRLGSQSYMNNANELPNERTITVTTWSVDREHTTRKNITLRVLP